MKFIALILSFTLMACQNQSSIPNPVETEKTEEKVNATTPERSYEDERSNWQKPEFIINSLGDLNGKTIADLGSGALGYFVFKIIAYPEVEKVIAIDIDKEAIRTLNVLTSALSPEKASKIEARLADDDDPKLNDNEVEVLLIVNTIAYLPERLEYLKKLRSKMKVGGQIVIVDFKTKRIPEDVDAPPYSERVYLHTIEEELWAAGFQNVITDDTSLEYQYYISANK